MNWFTGLGMFLVLWFLVLFMVLPFGVRPAEEDDKGHAAAAGAPANPRLKLKMLVTTLIAAALWLVLEQAIVREWISFRPPGP